MRWLVLPYVLLVGGCSASAPPAVLAWPDVTQVERITASVSGSVSRQSDLPEFEVPPEFIPALLQVLSPPEYHKHPPAEYLQEIGQLRITCRERRVLEVRLFFYGKEPVLFTVQGVPCRRGGPYKNLAPGKDKYLAEVLTLEGFLRAVKSGDQERVKKYLDLLDRSAGRVGEWSRRNGAEPTEPGCSVSATQRSCSRTLR